MKKNKIVVPALAIIAFSTAASIAGSVAWFTASRQVTVNAGTYAVVKTTSNLDVVVADGVGTTTKLQSNKNYLVEMKKGDVLSKLTDGSFNHKTGTVFAPNATVSGLSDGVTLAQAAADNTKLRRAQIPAVADPASPAVDIYTAVTWDITFSVNFGSISGDVGLFLNKAASSFTVEGTAKTAKGFRMAFYSNGNESSALTKNTVFADLQTGQHEIDNPAYDPAAAAADPEHYSVSAKTNTNNVKYCVDKDNFVGTDYVGTDYDLIDSADNGALPADKTAAATARARNDYLGTFVYKANEIVSLTYTVVCWFEGTDPEIVNRSNKSDYQSVTATLEFDAINLG